MRKIKKLLAETILLAVNSISKDIQTDPDQSANLTRAEAIKRLAEAYKNIK